jgi:hypothetical protein
MIQKLVAQVATKLKMLVLFPVWAKPNRQQKQSIPIW